MDLVRHNIKGEIVELTFMLTLFALVTALKAFAPDDEDEYIKNGDVLTIDEVFPKKDNQQELVDFIKHEYELNNAFILMPTNAILVNFNKNIFSNFKEEA